MLTPFLRGHRRDKSLGRDWVSGGLPLRHLPHILAEANELLFYMPTPTGGREASMRNCPREDNDHGTLVGCEGSTSVGTWDVAGTKATGRNTEKRKSVQKWWRGPVPQRFSNPFSLQWGDRTANRDLEGKTTMGSPPREDGQKSELHYEAGRAKGSWDGGPNSPQRPQESPCRLPDFRLRTSRTVRDSSSVV